MKNGNTPSGEGNILVSMFTMQARNLEALSGAVTSVLRQAQSLAGVYGDAISETHRHLAVDLWRGFSVSGDLTEATRPVKFARRAIDVSFSNAIAATQLATKLQLESLAALRKASLDGLDTLANSEGGAPQRKD